MVRQKRLLPLILILLLAGGLDALASDSFSLLTSRPAIEGGPFRVTRVSGNPGRLEWTVATQFSVSGDSLRESGTGRKIVDHLLVEDFTGAVGVTDWLSFGFDLPVVWLNRFQDPGPIVGTGVSRHTDLGDLRLESKLTVLSLDRIPVGLAVLPYLHFPTGNQQHFVGDETVVGGFLVAVEGRPHRRLTLALNSGIEIKEKVNFRNINLGNAVLTTSGGVAFQLIPDALDLSVEGIWRTSNANFLSERAENPSEVVGQLRWLIGKTGFSISAGGGAGLVKESGMGEWRSFLGIRYASFLSK